MKHITRDSKTILSIKDFLNNLLRYSNCSKKKISIVNNKFISRIKNVKIIIFPKMKTRGKSKHYKLN